ncbi:hypothetical protein ABEV00_21350 [Paenibacillus thiaminolyticus]|uniref:hypothetical protein n=1 Tax=Paenibacillus thiaminolyticus TaxID=49283 RepID=UPI003D2C2753
MKKMMILLQALLYKDIRKGTAQPANDIDYAVAGDICAAICLHELSVVGGDTSTHSGRCLRSVVPPEKKSVRACLIP